MISFNAFANLCARLLATLAIATLLVFATPLRAAPSIVSARPAPLTLVNLLGTFHRMTGFAAHFREEKRISLLAAPLASEGWIYFAAPGRLARRISSPVPSSMVVSGRKLAVVDSQGTQRLDLDEVPVARLIVDSFIDLLAGDLTTLRRSFDVTFVPEGANRWEVGLVPKIPLLAQLLTKIVLQGRGVVIGRLLVVEVGGDETETVFTSVDIARRFSTQEQQSLFRVGGP